MRFLLQVYAPDEDAGERAFHRAVFLFVSPAGDRLARGERGAARAFRCQLPRRNRYYGFDPAGEAEVVPRPLEGAELELALERDPWAVARREAAIAGGGGGGGSSEEATGGPEPFREMELVVEPEPEDDGSDVMEEVARVQKEAAAAGAAAGAAAAGAGAGGGPAPRPPTTAAAAAEAAASSGVGRATVARLLADYERRAREEGALDDDELPPSLVDELERALGRERAAFASFQARVARAPSQVLRYCFSEGASPLWPSASCVPGPGDVPPCSRCGGPRRFEFQVSLFAFRGLEEQGRAPFLRRSPKEALKRKQDKEAHAARHTTNG
jgi:pre-rRNA-processing protein TSR4